MYKYKKILLIIAFIYITDIRAQRLSLGYHYSIIGYQSTKLKDPYIFSRNSYYIYYAGNSKRDHKGVYGHTFNGASIGLNVNLDYKRYMFTTEFSLGGSTTKIPVYYPSSLGSDLSEDYFKFDVRQSYMSIGLLGLIKLTTHANGPFIQTGIQYSSNRFSENQNDLPFLIQMYTSENEMYRTIYTNQTQYAKGIIGLGTKTNDRYVSLRYTQRILGNPLDYPSAKFYHLDLVWSRTLNFQKLQKGYKIYLD
jgi:hypothetical protein